MSDRQTYGSYLKIDGLLALQHPLSKPEHHDELLFIVIHQVYELWFKQLLHEIDSAIAALDCNEVPRASRRFRRMHTIERVLVEQVDVLETMPPQEFNQFRDNLNPASGLQSVQFRELEFTCGLRNTGILTRLDINDAERARLERRASDPSLYDHVRSLLTRRGYDTQTPAQLIETYRDIYAHEATATDLYTLLEDMIEFDERFLLWRARHVRMVERMIGQMRGTGGTSGVDYLNATLDQKFFPELWQVRTLLGKGTYA